MLCFPDAQIKAQEELDRVIGRDRLPDFNDESELPYLGALLKEVYRYGHLFSFINPPFFSLQVPRWRPGGPLGLQPSPSSSF